MVLTDVNFAAVFIATLAVYLFGWFWYSPKAFGKAWIRGLGYRKEEITMQWYHLLGGFAVTFLTAWILAALIRNFAIIEIQAGVSFAFWIWLGFIFPSFFAGYLWEKKTFTVFLINVGFQLVSLLFFGAFLTYWR